MFNENELLEIRALIVAVDKLLLESDLQNATMLSGMLKALTDRITEQVDEVA